MASTAESFRVSWAALVSTAALVFALLQGRTRRSQCRVWSRTSTPREEVHFPHRALRGRPRFRRVSSERRGHVLPQLRDDLLLAHLLHDTPPRRRSAPRRSRRSPRRRIPPPVPAFGGAGLSSLVLPFVVLRLVFVRVSRSRFRERRRAPLSRRASFTGVVNFTDAPPAPSPMMARRAHFSHHSSSSASGGV